MTLYLPPAMIGEMIAHAYEDLPNECCGLITSENGVATKLHRLRNADASPFRYTMDPNELFQVMREIDHDDSRILVVYHSHVASEAYPSNTDIRLAYLGNTSLEIFPNAYYVLLSLQDRTAPIVKAYRIRSREVYTEEISDKPPVL